MKGHLIMRGWAEHKLGDNWPEIECFRCGVCCVRYRPKVTKAEMKRIARKVGISLEVFFATYVKTVPTKDGYILQSSADTCPFLQWDKKGVKAACSIHSSRPKACRDWVPSLSRTECQEGLVKLKNSGELLLPADIYGSNKEIKRLFSAVRGGDGG